MDAWISTIGLFVLEGDGSRSERRHVVAALRYGKSEDGATITVRSGTLLVRLDAASLHLLSPLAMHFVKLSARRDSVHTVEQWRDFRLHPLVPCHGATITEAADDYIRSATVFGVLDRNEAVRFELDEGVFPVGKEARLCLPARDVRDLARRYEPVFASARTPRLRGRRFQWSAVSLADYRGLYPELLYRVAALPTLLRFARDQERAGAMFGAEKSPSSIFRAAPGFDQLSDAAITYAGDVLARAKTDAKLLEYLSTHPPVMFTEVADNSGLRGLGLSLVKEVPMAAGAWAAAVVQRWTARRAILAARLTTAMKRLATATNIDLRSPNARDERDVFKALTNLTVTPATDSLLTVCDEKALATEEALLASNVKLQSVPLASLLLGANSDDEEALLREMARSFPLSSAIVQNVNVQLIFRPIEICRADDRFLQYRRLFVVGCHPHVDMR